MIKKTADSKNDKYSVVFEGKTDSILKNALIEMELKIKGKYRDLLELYPLDSIAEFELKTKTVKEGENSEA